MKYFFTKYNSSIGYYFNNIINNEDEVFYNDVNVSNYYDIYNNLKYINPDVVIHSLPFDNIDDCNIDFNNSYKLNIIGTQNVVDACKILNIKLIFISSSKVFNGSKRGLYNIDDVIDPKSFYGYTYAISENYIKELKNYFIVRIDSLFGIKEKDFINEIIDSNKDIVIERNQLISLAYSKDVASLIYELSKTNKYGYYHVHNRGYTTWYNLAKYILKINNKDNKVNLLDKSIYENYQMDNSSIYKNNFNDLPEWMDAVNRYNEEIKLTRK